MRESDSSEKLFQQTSERIVFEVGVSAYRMRDTAVSRKGCGIRCKLRAASRICRLSAEWWGRLLLFDLHALKKASGRVSACRLDRFPDLVAVGY